MKDYPHGYINTQLFCSLIRYEKHIMFNLQNYWFLNKLKKRCFPSTFKAPPPEEHCGSQGRAGMQPPPFLVPDKFIFGPIVLEID